MKMKKAPVHALFHKFNSVGHFEALKIERDCPNIDVPTLVIQPIAIFTLAWQITKRYDVDSSEVRPQFDNLSSLGSVDGVLFFWCKVFDVPSIEGILLYEPSFFSIMKHY